MIKSSRFVSFMTALLVTHLMMTAVLFTATDQFAQVSMYAYGFLGTFGFVTGLSKTAEKWNKNGQ